jgi:hypothetical protein
MSFKRLGGLALGAVTAYYVQDAVNDVLLFNVSKKLIVQKASDHHRFLTSIGAHTLDECSLGPWYDASVTVTHGGMVSTIYIPCKGPLRSSDIIVKLIRKGGLRWPMLYNILGGQWDLIAIDAFVGMGQAGSVLTSLSLLEAAPPSLLAQPSH